MSDLASLWVDKPNRKIILYDEQRKVLVEYTYDRDAIWIQVLWELCNGQVFSVAHQIHHSSRKRIEQFLDMVRDQYKRDFRIQRRRIQNSPNEETSLWGGEKV